MLPWDLVVTNINLASDSGGDARTIPLPIRNPLAEYRSQERPSVLRYRDTARVRISFQQLRIHPSDAQNRVQSRGTMILASVGRALILEVAFFLNASRAE